MSNKLISPCISICKTDPSTGYCYGCGRTKEEKKKWKLSETNEEWKKKNLLENKVKELSYENDELKARVEKLEKIAIALTSNKNPINVSNLYPDNNDHLIPTRGDL